MSGKTTTTEVQPLVLSFDQVMREKAFNAGQLNIEREATLNKEIAISQIQMEQEKIALSNKEISIKKVWTIGKMAFGTVLTGTALWLSGSMLRGGGDSATVADGETFGG